MRDLDRIKEVREFRVTGPQLTTLAVSALVVVVAGFGIGFQLGRLQSPVDLALLEPIGSDADAGSLLAEMLAEKEGRTMASVAAPPPAPLAATDDTAEPAEPAETAIDEVADGLDSSAVRLDVDDGREPINDGEPLTASDVPPAYVREVVERAYSEEEASRRVVEAAAEAERLEAARVEAAKAEVLRAEAAKAEDLRAAAAKIEEEARIAAANRSPSQGSSDGLPGAPRGRGFTVQVGAYESLADATSTVRALQAGGAEVFHVEALVNGKTWHRVRVGLYPSREAAEAAAKKLQDATPYSPFVTSQP